MKYFTSEWWGNGCEDETVIEKYKEYLDSIASKLPEQLIKIQNEFTLHDSNVKEINSNFENGSVSIRLRGWDLAFEKEMDYSLLFTGVTAFRQFLPQQEYLESELGDLAIGNMRLLMMLQK
ncbi:MAG: DUF4085 family protein [Candidatus Thiodiazotropha sp. (ex Monitilora ramsayi)]|nr:DUF4085 family protein [Candidatus Thiodiazotropha sp. (ex Monitilora ramsayi)]